MKIVYKLSSPLGESEIALLNEIVNHRSFGASRYDYDLEVFRDREIRKIVCDYIDARNSLDVLDKYSDEYQSWRAARSRYQWYLPIVIQLSKAVTEFEIDTELYYNQEDEYEELERIEFGDSIKYM